MRHTPGVRHAALGQAGLLALTGTLVLGVYLSTVRPDDSVGPAPFSRVFESTDPAWLQQLGPEFGLSAPASPSTWVAAAATSSPGDDVTRINLLAAVFVAATIVLLAWLLRRANVRGLAVAGACAAMAFGPALWRSATTAEGTLRPSVSSFFLLAAFAFATAALPRLGARSWLAVIALVLAALDDLSLLASAIPLWALLAGPPDQGTRRRLAWMLAFGAAGVVGCHVLSSTALWSSQPVIVRRLVPEPGFIDVLVGSWRWPGLPHQPAGWIAWTRVRDLGAVWLGDLGALGTALAALGLAWAWLSRTSLTTSFAVAAVVVGIAGVLPGTSTPNERWVTLAPCAWALVGFGLEWIGRWPVHGARTGLAVLALILPAGGLAAGVAQRRGTDRIQLAAACREIVSRRGAVVATAPPTDRVVLRLTGASKVVRVPLRRDIIDLAGSGRPVFALSPSDRRLQLLGAKMDVVPPGEPAVLGASAVAGFAACVDVGSEWVDVPAARDSVRLGVDLARATGVRLYLSASRPLHFRLGAFEGWPDPSLEVDSWRRDDDQGDAALTRAAALDGFPLQRLPGNWRHLYRVRASTGGGTSGLLALALGGLSTSAWAKALDDGHSPPVASLCPGPGGMEVHARRSGAETVLALDDRDGVGDGWHDAERTGGGVARWTGSLDAEMFWRVERPADLEVSVEAHPSATDGTRQTIGLRVGDVPLAEFPMRPGPETYTWRVPAAAWRPGITPVGITTSSLTALPLDSGDTRTLGVRVLRIVVRGVGS